MARYVRDGTGICTIDWLGFIEFGRSYGDHELEFYCHMMRNLESLNAYECLVDKQTCRSLRPNLIGNQGR